MTSDDWMLQQQVRAENDAEAWRRLREDLSAPLPAAPAGEAIDYHRRGGGILKALVRFGLGTLGAHVAWLAAVASQLGQFEIWLAMAAGFAVALSLSMFGPARGFVGLLADAARWMIILAVALSGLWLAFQFLS